MEPNKETMLLFEDMKLNFGEDFKKDFIKEGYTVESSTKIVKESYLEMVDKIKVSPIFKIILKQFAEKVDFEFIVQHLIM